MPNNTLWTIVGVLLVIILLAVVIHLFTGAGFP